MVWEGTWLSHICPWRSRKLKSWDIGLELSYRFEICQASQQQYYWGIYQITEWYSIPQSCSFRTSRDMVVRHLIAQLMELLMPKSHSCGFISHPDTVQTQHWAINIFPQICHWPWEPHGRVYVGTAVPVWSLSAVCTTVVAHHQPAASETWSDRPLPATPSLCQGPYGHSSGMETMKRYKKYSHESHYEVSFPQTEWRMIFISNQMWSIKFKWLDSYKNQTRHHRACKKMIFLPSWRVAVSSRQSHAWTLRCTSRVPDECPSALPSGGDNPTHTVLLWSLASMRLPASSATALSRTHHGCESFHPGYLWDSGSGPGTCH